MSGEVTQRLKPEEKEILRKREELAAIRATLAGEKCRDRLSFRLIIARLLGLWTGRRGQDYSVHARMDCLIAVGFAGAWDRGVSPHRAVWNVLREF